MSLISTLTAPKYCSASFRCLLQQTSRAKLVKSVTIDLTIVSVMEHCITLREASGISYSHLEGTCIRT